MEGALQPPLSYHFPDHEMIFPQIINTNPILYLIQNGCSNEYE